MRDWGRGGVIVTVTRSRRIPTATDQSESITCPTNCTSINQSVRAAVSYYAPLKIHCSFFLHTSMQRGRAILQNNTTMFRGPGATLRVERACFNCCDGSLRQTACKKDVNTSRDSSWCGKIPTSSRVETP